MGTQKWCMLDHIAANMREVGGAEYLRLGIFESVHRSFNRQYRRSLQEKKSAIKETLDKIIEDGNGHQFQELKCKSDKFNL